MRRKVKMCLLHQSPCRVRRLNNFVWGACISMQTLLKEHLLNDLIENSMYHLSKFFSSLRTLKPSEMF